jgi:hypothetical protein
MQTYWPRDEYTRAAEPLDGEVLEPKFRPSAKDPPLDIGAIAAALRNADLLKSG